MSNYISGKCKGITITAYAAGHTIGGTIWKIKKDNEEIVYAVDYNHKKERHLDGTVLHINGVVLDALSRPSLMITDAYNSLIIHPARKHRDAALFGNNNNNDDIPPTIKNILIHPEIKFSPDNILETIMSTLGNNGCVLLPTDSSARVLELAYLLDQHWTFHQVSYPLILLTHQSYRTIQFAKSMLEWMSDAINRQFDSKRENPFEFRYLRLCHRYKDLSKYPGPKVVLASNLSLETGYARDLLLEWGTSESNALILTDRGPPNSLARRLYYEWDNLSVSSNNPIKPVVGLNITMNLLIRKKVPLEGTELLDYKSEQRKKQEREAAQAALIAKSKSIIEDDESDESESEIGDTDIEELLSTQFDLYVRDATKYGGFFKQTQSYLMFPYVEKRKRYDDYGEIIQVDQFARRIVDGGRDGDINGDKVDLNSDKDEAEKDDPSNPSSESNVPTKYVSYSQNINFRCQIRFIDLEGTNDGRSLKTIVPQVQPRKLLEDYDIAFVNGKISFPPDSSLPMLDVVPIEESNSGNHNPVFVGEVKLTELKRVLQSEGIVAEFKGEGVLVCNEKVAVRKSSAGQLILEGSLSEDYYKIRSIIYAQHAIL
ncbi:3142_t:CDS:2 [Acaulospora colombiana]|uniref:3142_t:CDS:1 n=1 Tax=Acaulospora colombiana TaxID=27376 RepID=A0ACA9KYS6_9GLOM|nr:3142_t:CDS:2 [Acaulospora colombiana]